MSPVILILYFFSMKFRTDREAKKEAVKESFHTIDINLINTLRVEDATKLLDDKQDIDGQTTQPSPQKKGQEIHQDLAEKIKTGSRKGAAGEMLERMETEFACKFIEAEVSISGFAVKKNTQVDLWSGKMDAVAIGKEDVSKVFVVDWKTTNKAGEQVLSHWWKNATNFKRPLYQCLVYRELLQAHFKHHGVNAKVGIILVPFHQKYREMSYPGLCLDFQKMDEGHLLDGLKNFEWYAVLDESFFVHTIKMPCKLIQDSLVDPADYVDESTNILKDDTPLKDMLNDDATVGDLRQLLELPLIKVESIKKEEKTNEELEEVNKKCLNYVVMTVNYQL